MKTIKVTIKPGGSSKIEVVSGFSGKDCLKETKSLEEALGTVDKRLMKPDSKDRVIVDQTKVGA
jgi:hypothetical protein